MCFRFIFVRWRDKSVLISESIDDSDMSASENQVVVIKQVFEDQGGYKQWGWRQWWRIGCCGSQAFGYIIVCQFERCDPYNNQRSGKMPNVYWHYYTDRQQCSNDDCTSQHLLMCGMCGVHWKRRVLLIFICATIIDLKFQDETQC